MTPGHVGEVQSEIGSKTTEPVLQLWAKATSSEPRKYHCLICHLVDVAAVAENLWDIVLPVSTKRHVCSLLGNPLCDTVKTWMAFLAGLHDIGKCSPAFQKKCPERKAELLGLGYRFPKEFQLTTGKLALK